jgi:hypothetical protein
VVTGAEKISLSHQVQETTEVMKLKYFKELLIKTQKGCHVSNKRIKHSERKRRSKILYDVIKVIKGFTECSPLQECRK